MVARDCDGDTRERSPARGRGKCHFLGPGRAAVASRAGPTGLIGGEPGHAPVSQGPAAGLGGGRGLLGMTAPAPAPLSRAFASPQLLPPPGQSSQTQLASSP